MKLMGRPNFPVLQTHKKGYENGGIHEDQCQDRGPAISEAIGDGASEEDPNERAALSSLEEGALPFCLNGIT